MKMRMKMKGHPASQQPATNPWSLASSNRLPLSHPVGNRGVHFPDRNRVAPATSTDVKIGFALGNIRARSDVSIGNIVRQTAGKRHDRANRQVAMVLLLVLSVTMKLTRLSDEGLFRISIKVDINHGTRCGDEKANLFASFQDVNLPVSGHHQN
jgi:hypothetical protein